VRQFHLQDVEATGGHAFIRAEMNKRLHGAVTLAERNLRRGNYYHLRWQGLSGTGLVKILFEYRQARTGARVKRRLITAEASRKGEREIVVGGREYLRDGHVQSWRFRLFDGEKLVAEKQSYLWE
jgi:hypothetical protein